MVVWSWLSDNPTDSLDAPARDALGKRVMWLGLLLEAGVLAVCVLALILRRCRYGIPFRASMGISGLVLTVFLVLYLYCIIWLGRM